MSLLQNQTLKAAAAFIVFSNILVANKYANGMHWMNGFAYATHGLLQFLLTVLTLVTLFAALIFGLRDAFRYLPQMSPMHFGKRVRGRFRVSGGKQLNFAQLVSFKTP